MNSMYKALCLSPFIMAFLILRPMPASAQKASSNRAEQQWQTLEWSEDESGSVLFYEVIVEKRDNKDGGRYTEAVRVRVTGEEHSVQMKPLLPVGEYRYKVIAYNLLNLKASESDWSNFAIMEAHQPVIKTVLTEDGSPVIHLDRAHDDVLEITGKNLFTSAATSSGALSTQYALINTDSGETIEMTVNEADGQKAKAHFDSQHLKQGVYRVRATDKSGLASKKDSPIVRVEVGQTNDYYICAFFLPAFNVVDTAGNFDTVHPIGMGARVAATSSMDETLYFGAGVAMTYNKVNIASGDSGNMINGSILFICQKPILRRKAMLEWRLGGGIAVFSSTKGSDSTSLFPSATSGASIQYTLFKGLYAEIGGEGVLTMARSAKGGISMELFIMPQASIGYRFTK